MVMLLDRAPLERVRKLADGRIAAVARFARSGVYTYSGSEVGRPDLATVNVYRPESEVFDQAAMASFGHKAITIGQADAIGTAEARRAVEGDRIEFERRSNARAIEADDDLDHAQKDQQLALNERVAAAQRQALNAEALAEADEQRLEDQRRQIEAERNSAQYATAALDAQARIAITRQERNDIERRILASMEREEVAQLEAEIAAGRIADAQQARADLATAQSARRTYAEQQGESPLERRRREVRQTAANMGDVMEDIELEAVDRLTDGIAEASTEFLKLGGVAGDVLNSILNDLIRLSVQQAIFGSGGAGSGGGALGGLGKLLGFSSGGYTGDGPTDQVAGVVHRGEYVVPADTVKRIGVENLAALSNARAAASMVGTSVAAPTAGVTVLQTIQLNAQGAVMTQDLVAHMNALAVQAANEGAQGGRALAAKDMSAMMKPRM